MGRRNLGSAVETVQLRAQRAVDSVVAVAARAGTHTPSTATWTRARRCAVQRALGTLSSLAAPRGQSRRVLAGTASPSVCAAPNALASFSLQAGRLHPLYCRWAVPAGPAWCLVAGGVALPGAVVTGMRVWLTAPRHRRACSPGQPDGAGRRLAAGVVCGAHRKRAHQHHDLGRGHAGRRAGRRVRLVAGGLPSRKHPRRPLGAGGGDLAPAWTPHDGHAAKRGHLRQALSRRPGMRAGPALPAQVDARRPEGLRHIKRGATDRFSIWLRSLLWTNAPHSARHVDAAAKGAGFVMPARPSGAPRTSRSGFGRLQGFGPLPAKLSSRPSHRIGCPHAAG